MMTWKCDADAVIIRDLHRQITELKAENLRLLRLVAELAS